MSARLNTSDMVRVRWLSALAGIAAGAVVLALVDPSALCLLPVLALAVPLSMRRYPGERMIAALSAAGRRRRWARPRPIAPRARAATVVARGGLLLARSLAVRPPPVFRVGR
jgi:hypothetical protein